MFRSMWIATAVAVVLAMAAAGCGDDDGGDETSAGTQSTNPASVTPPPRLADEGEISYCTFLTAPPRQYTKGGELQGVNTEVGNEIAERLGLTPEWEVMSFTGLITSLQAERCDAILGTLFINAERKKMFNMLPYGLEFNQTIVPADNPAQISDFDSMQGHKVGVVSASTYEGILKEKNAEYQAAGDPQIEIVSLPTPAEMIHQVEADILDAAGATLSSAQYLVDQAGGTVEMLGDPFGRVTTGIAFRKEDAELYEAVREALSQMFEDGKYQQLFEEAGLSALALKEAP